MVDRSDRQLRKPEFLGQDAYITDLLVVARMASCSATDFFGFGPVLLAKLPLAADQTRARMFQHNQGEHVSAQLFQCGRIGVHNHSFGRRRRARSRVASHIFDLDYAQPTSPEWRQGRMRAQMRNRNVVPKRAFEYSLAFLGGNGFSIYS